MNIINGILTCLTLAMVAKGAIVTQTGAGGAVPDNNATGVSFDITIADTRVVSDVRLFFTNFSHTYMGDLVITLEHVGVAGPVTVLNRLGNTQDAALCVYPAGCRANLISGGTYGFITSGTDWASLGDTNLTDYTYDIPFDDYTSFNSLAALTGSSANGTWRIHVSDNESSDFSNSNWTWGVDLTVPDETGVPEPSAAALVGLALASLAVRLRHR